MFSSIAQAFTTLINGFVENLPFLCILLASLWGIQLLNSSLSYRLNCLGIYPRTWHGLIGIVFSPFLHGSWQHLFFNSIPLLVLSALILIEGGLWFFLEVSLIILVISGIALWLLGRRGFHVGASTVIMGYFSFLLANAYHHRSAVTILLAVLCLYYFGGLFCNLLPSEEKVSWEGHVLGFVSGLVASYWVSHYSLLSMLFIGHYSQ